MTMQLGPWRGVYHPSYKVEFFKAGDPRKRVRGFDASSIVSISTSKTLQDISGSWQILVKDARARDELHEMDVVKIWMKGHNHGWGEVMRGLVDEVAETGAADPNGASESTTITGRCMGKYLQVNSLFLPVWDPKSVLPTALTFGIGGPFNIAGANQAKDTPRAIFDFILHSFVYGKRNMVGESGIPNSRFWLSTKKRFSRVTAANGKEWKVPFVQFNESTIDQVLSALEILGFTEAWVDEIGNVVFRHPQWDAPVAYKMSTSGVQSYQLARSDVGLYTYVEVVPAGNPALAASSAQALMAGRAPVPSSYLAGTGSNTQGSMTYASQEFVIDTDRHGKVTAKGLKNRWYKLQRGYGLRPLQITSPLLFTPEDAQVQAEGLLRFMSRFVKSGTITIPGEPVLRIGNNIQIMGEFRGQKLNRTYYIEGVSHSYTDGQSYTTTLNLTHGRDPWDPKWGMMVLPQYDASQLAWQGGTLSPAQPGTGSPSGGNTDGLAGNASVQSALNWARQLSSLSNRYPSPDQHFPGSNASDSPPPLDCSSSTSWILYRAGMFSGKDPWVSGQFATSWGDPGQGREMTVWANDGHVFIEFYVSNHRLQANTSPGSGKVGVVAGDSGSGCRLFDWGQNGAADANSGSFTPRHWPGT